MLWFGVGEGMGLWVDLSKLILFMFLGQSFCIKTALPIGMKSYFLQSVADLTD